MEGYGAHYDPTKDMEFLRDKLYSRRNEKTNSAKTSENSG